ncbi:MAG TPA: tyrosine-protein phosphatase [Bryobacteraceae bacterium]|nr:tyrosine-protein phosphatase [Bryobacteraceae bacterium]
MKSIQCGQTIVLGLFFLTSAAFAGETAIQANGIPNFHQVNDHIFRGAQPSSEGWDSLAKLGVKVVIDLRRDHEEGHSIASEARAVEAAGMRYVNLPMNGIVAPQDSDIRKALDLMNGSAPVFVHCKLGKDRTGTVIACYRISHDQWQNDRALKEARGIGLHRIEFGMKRYIAGFQSGASSAPVVASTVE